MASCYDTGFIFLKQTTERLTIIQNEIIELMISITTLFYIRFRGRMDS